MGYHSEQDYVFRDRYPERNSIYELFDERSAEVRRDIEFHAIRYGNHPRETLDLFLGDPGGPLILFVHGGYWQSLSKERFSFFVAPFVKKGFSVALPNYPLAPDASVGEIVNSVKRSVLAVFETAASLGCHPPCWISAGHSAGGHLAAMLAVSELSEGEALPSFAGCAPISGIFDLEPLIGTSLNQVLSLDSRHAATLSPAKIPVCRGSLLAFVGSAETEGFQRQSSSYVDTWLALGGVGRLVRMSERNHYTILADLIEGDSEIAREVVGMADDFLEQGGAR